MEFLVFLLIIIFVAVTDNKKKKKGKTPTPAIPAQRREKVRARRKPVVTEPEAAAPVMDVPHMVEEPVPVFAEGVGLMDGEGCLGGSMQHEHTEGEAHEEHHRHMEALHRREAEETRAAEAALELSEMNLQKLRRAVVMAEVLGKPVALRGRR